jgi:hypothetical protein
VEQLETVYQEVQEICEKREALKMQKKDEVFAEFEEFNEYFDKLVPRL